MLKVCEPSPPVPTMSTRCVRSATSTLVENSRITCAAAVISPMVSFFTRRPTSSAAIITGDISPLMMRRISASISSWKISRCSMVRVSASVLVMGMVGLLELRRLRAARRWRGRCPSASTSRWVTKRSRYRPVASTPRCSQVLRPAPAASLARAGRRTRCWSAAAARSRRAGRCKPVGQAPRVAHGRRPGASTWWSSAYSAAAASTPAWRMRAAEPSCASGARARSTRVGRTAPSRPARPGPC